MKMMVLTTFLTFQSVAQTSDPYLWLEDVEGKQSMDWVLAQNRITADKLTRVQGFDQLKQRFLETFNDKDKIIYPSMVGNYIYHLLQDEEHVRGVWRRCTKDDYLKNTPKWEIVLDLDVLSAKDGKKWVFHGAQFLEPANTICLVSLSDGGTDEDEIREFDAVKKEFIANGFFLPSSKGSASWINENELLISRNFGEGTTTTSGYPRFVKRLKRGMPLEKATTLMEAPENFMGIWGSTDYEKDKYEIYINKWENFYNHSMYYVNNDKPVLLKFPGDAQVNGLYKDQDLVSLNSDWTVGKETFKAGSLVSINHKQLLNGELNVKLIYAPDAKSSIDGVAITKNGLIITLLRNVQNELLTATFDNSKWTINPVKTNAFGRIAVVDADKNQSGYFYSFSSYVQAPTLYYVDGKDTKVVQAQKPLFKSDNLVVEQFESTSKDGTKIPYYIVHRKDIPYDGSNPTLVYAYGGFNISQKPNYNVTTGIGWLEKGGVYVVASIRGGGEFGPAWHQAAIKEKRQNAYDDFYSVCEDLIARKITTPAHMGAFGWSNGGLMAGVVATQRPDLFNAVIIGAPLLDMQRYNKMLAGASWMGEYGNPDVPEEWEYISKYSPYHNVEKGKKYPEVFFVTSTKDDRVHPAHARKMAAKMMEQGHPVYYYETVEGGHGASSTNDQSAFNAALMYSYLAKQLKTTE